MQFLGREVMKELIGDNNVGVQRSQPRAECVLNQIGDLRLRLGSVAGHVDDCWVCIQADELERDTACLAPAGQSAQPVTAAAADVDDRQRARRNASDRVLDHSNERGVTAQPAIERANVLQCSREVGSSELTSVETLRLDGTYREVEPLESADLRPVLARSSALGMAIIGERRFVSKNASAWHIGGVRSFLTHRRTVASSINSNNYFCV